MTQGSYKRCAAKGCRRKAQPEYCITHAAARAKLMADANPSLTQMIDGRLKYHGLI